MLRSTSAAPIGGYRIITNSGRAETKGNALITTDDQLIAVLAERTGLNRDVLFTPVTVGRIQGSFCYPLQDDEAENVVRRITEDMTKVVSVGSAAESDPDSRYVWLHEMISHYASAETRLVVTRVLSGGHEEAQQGPYDEHHDSTHAATVRPRTMIREAY
ncbi:hypothetical protein, partial [Nonomuraea sp. NPDC049695]|uniref:hypothetical protein n=1 Tax=Nonomuraea sp. NPDC049695 TaxID=3154734 RepID=UPI00342E6C08